ncbi:MAG: hypothetical protein ACE5HJ_09640, partial [Thermoplasmata archaeon]
MVQSRLLRLEMAAILVALIVVETGAILLELRSAIILDWFIALVPLVWLNLSLLFVYAFLRQLYGTRVGSRASSQASENRMRRLFRPDFQALQAAVKRPFMRLLWVGSGFAYGLIYMYLQGILVVDPAGDLVPVISILESPIGYGPALAWAPTTTFGLLLRPYTFAAAVALSLFSGLVLTLFVAVISASREAIRALPGPLAGFGVMCPACVASPATGLFLAYLTPAVTLAGLASTSVFSLTLAVSTLLLITTFLLLWMTTSWLSRILVGA